MKIACPCGETHTMNLNHYEVRRAECGRSYWALQPKRNSPLELFRWPGSNTRDAVKPDESSKVAVSE